MLQRASWTCSAASTCWLLRSLGVDVAESQVVEQLGRGMSPQLGLVYGDGRDLAALLRDRYALDADGVWVDFDHVLARAGQVPIAMGGVGWYHWTGVRGLDGDTLLLANPAPGWMGVDQRLTRRQFSALGPFAAVWVEL